ncbi:MAG: hypothetical protein QNJ73_02910 [Gammaproteobacteria bacterium]|nr:hypothetical protein [Gammaproteobacteria bacterium]
MMSMVAWSQAPVIEWGLDDGNTTRLVERNRVSVFDAKAEQIEQYSLSKHKDRLELYVRLGFSTTGKELKDGYLLTSLGDEHISESRTLGIDMTPKRHVAGLFDYRWYNSLSHAISKRVSHEPEG